MPDAYPGFIRVYFDDFKAQLYTKEVILDLSLDQFRGIVKMAVGWYHPDNRLALLAIRDGLAYLCNEATEGVKAARAKFDREWKYLNKKAKRDPKTAGIRQHNAELKNSIKRAEAHRSLVTHRKEVFDDITKTYQF